MALAPPLAFDRVTFGYRAGPVLRDVSFVLQPGEAIALLGPNGAGKTTLTRLAIGLLHPDAGAVRTAGIATTGRQPEDFAAAAGYLFQHPDSQLFERTVEADVAFGPKQLGWPRERISAAVALVLQELGLDGDARRHPYDLPLPRRRLVALAGALVAGPSLLLVDEPTAALDRAGRDTVRRALKARLEGGAGVLVVTHDLGFAAEVTGRALVLKEGSVVFDGPLSDALDAAREAPFPAPPAIELARRLGLPGAPTTSAAIAGAIVQRCRASGRLLS